MMESPEPTHMAPELRQGHGAAGFCSKWQADRTRNLPTVLPEAGTIFTHHLLLIDTQ